MAHSALNAGSLVGPFRGCIYFQYFRQKVRTRMPEWLNASLSQDLTISATTLFVRLVVSVAFGFAVAAIYALSHGKHHENGESVSTTIILLSGLVAMVTLVIGNSVARAFGLVGALSIVRFRTSIQDTRDTAFVIFAVTVGMAAGAGLFLVPLLGIPILGFVAVGLSKVSSRNSHGNGGCQIRIRVAADRVESTDLTEILAHHLRRYQAVTTRLSRNGDTFDYIFRGQLRGKRSLEELVSVLRAVDGIQSVKILRN
jgi:uncharacterized membrane protein YhiD involved in acid resistance